MGLCYVTNQASDPFSVSHLSICALSCNSSNTCHYLYFHSGATEDAINQAREAFHAHLTNVRKVQKETTDYTDEELMMEEKDLEPEFSGKAFILLLLIRN